MLFKEGFPFLLQTVLYLCTKHAIGMPGECRLNLAVYLAINDNPLGLLNTQKTIMNLIV